MPQKKINKHHVPGIGIGRGVSGSAALTGDDFQCCRLVRQFVIAVSVTLRHGMELVSQVQKRVDDVGVKVAAPALLAMMLAAFSCGMPSL
jgi:hypothetical protein